MSEHGDGLRRALQRSLRDVTEQRDTERTRAEAAEKLVQERAIQRDKYYAELLELKELYRVRSEAYLAAEAKVEALVTAGDGLRHWVTEFISVHANTAPDVVADACAARRAWDKLKGAK